MPSIDLTDEEHAALTALLAPSQKTTSPSPRPTTALRMRDW
jgi:hypothetical protein